MLLSEIKTEPGPRRVPSETELRKLCDEFKSEFDGQGGKKEWGATLTDCATEHGNCSMVSNTFIDWMRARGLDAKFISGEKATARSWAESAKRHGEGDEHQAVRVGSHVVDWTARQFDEKFPIPRIYDVGTFGKEWEAVKG